MNPVKLAAIVLLVAGEIVLGGVLLATGGRR